MDPNLSDESQLPNLGGDDNESQPPIIKKIKKGHGGHHGGAWKVAYADFVTAMMALFIVLWVMGQSEEVKEAVAGYFKDPVGFSTKSGSMLDGAGQSPLDLNIQQEMERMKQEKEDLEKIGDKLIDELKDDTGLMNLADQVNIEIANDGLKIELIDSENDLFFEVGTSELKSEARTLLAKVGTEISKMQNKIRVEGHTDSRQYQNDGSGYSNFELSSDRANSAKRALVRGGVSEKQIDEITGYADTRLRNIQDPFSSTNRRISITVKFNSNVR
ncbi:MAG: OmpA family protein [Melioribacteraceae bacterium]|nr:OmpA family protein [Melioribacteraceae bacterium]